MNVVKSSCNDPEVLWGSRLSLTGGIARERQGRKERRRGGGGQQILGNASQQDRRSNLKALSQRLTRTRKVGQYDNDMITPR